MPSATRAEPVGTGWLIGAMARLVGTHCSETERQCLQPVRHVWVSAKVERCWQ